MGFLSLVAKLGLDISGYETGLKRAQSQTQKWGGEISSGLKSQLAGALSVGAIIAASKQTITFASHITDLSDALDISATKLQEWSYAATQTGATADDFTGAASKVLRSRAEAMKDPRSDAALAFTRLGVSAQELKSMKVEDIVDKIGVAFRNSSNPQELFAAGFATMGRGAMPVMGAMRQGLAEMGAEAHRLGLVMSDEVRTALDDAGDAMDRFALKTKVAIGGGLAGYILPILNNVIERIQTTSAFFGALLANISTKEGRARSLSIGGAADVVNQMNRDEQGVPNRDKKQITPLDDLTKTKKEKASKEAAQKGGGLGQVQLNNLQQIGAYSGVDPIVKELQLSHTTQKKIEANTKKAVSKVMSEGASFG